MFESREELVINKDIQKKVDAYKVSLSFLVFPGFLESKPDVSDFEYYFSSINHQLKETQKTLPQLMISPLSNAVLDGLTVFSEDSGVIHFDELILDLDESQEIEKEEFLEKLKILLKHGSDHDLKVLRFQDNGMKIELKDWYDIAKFIEENAITIECRLPEGLNNNSIQRRIDKAVSMAQYEKSLKPKEAPQIETEAVVPRFLVKPNSASILGGLGRVVVDVQAEKQHAQETVVAEQIQIQTKVTQVPKTERNVYYYHEKSNSISLSYQKNPERLVVSPFEIEQLWFALFGHIRLVFKSPDPESGQDMAHFDVPPSENDTELNFRHSFLGGVSHKAYQQLLKHHKQFKSGIDLNHLPDGFQLITQETHPKKNRWEKVLVTVLDYDPELENKNDPLAVCLQPQTQTKPLALFLLEQTRELLKNGNERDRLIESYLDKVDGENHYDANAVRLFQQYLPQLLHFDYQQLQTLFKITFEGDTLQKEKFEFMLKNLRDFARIYPNGFQEDISIDRIVPPYFSDKEDQKSFIELAVAYAKSNHTEDQEHLLLRLVASKPDLKAEIEKWVRLLEMTDTNLDALLDVYCQKGEHGLIQLFSYWSENEGILALLQNTLFAQAPSYLPFLEPNFQAAVEQIKDFKDFKKQWWEKLLRQHASTVGFDDLPSLVRSFLAFEQKIKDKNLSFYELDEDSFNDAKNMPTILARMWTILEHCDARDRTAQWGCITHIALHSNGAMRAIQEAQQGTTYGFIVPEMGIDSKNYTKMAQYKAPTTLDSIASEKHGSGAIELDQKAFYRILASHQTRLSLPFYQNALHTLTEAKFDTKIEAMLAAILIGSTVGSKNQAFLESEEKMSELWDNLIKELKELEPTVTLKPLFINQLGFQKKIIEPMYQKTISLNFPSPPLPILKRYWRYLIDSYKKINLSILVLSELRNKLERFLETIEILEKGSQSLGDYVYLGFKFYPNNSDNQFLTHYAEVVKKFSGDTDFSNPFLKLVAEPTFSIYGGIVRLISTFHLGEGNNASEELERLYQLAQIMKELRNPQRAFFNEHLTLKSGKYSAEYYYVLQLLAQMDKNVTKDGRDLSAADLIDFLETITQNPEYYFRQHNKEEEIHSDIETLVQARFSDFFHPDFFTNLRSGKLSDQTMSFIKTYLPDDQDDRVFVASLLKHLRLHGDKESCKLIIERIASIFNALDKAEKVTFRKEMEHNEATFKELPTAHEFTEFLDAIRNRGHARDFIFFITQAKKQKADNPLIRATAYMTHLTRLVTVSNDLSSLLLLQTLLAHLMAAVPIGDLEEKASDLVAIVNDLDSLAESKSVPVNLMIQFFEHYLVCIKPTILPEASNCIATLKAAFKDLDSDIISSLCYQYQMPKEPFTAKDLLTLLEMPLGVEHRQSLLKIITVLLNNGKIFSQQELDDFIPHFKAHAALIVPCYENPPYPSLSQINQWKDKEDFLIHYKMLDKEPYERDLRNAFNTTKAMAQIDDFHGSDISPEDIQVFSENVMKARDYSTDDLIQRLKAYKDSPISDDELMTLIALTAELLYRTKGSEGEINTTQYLAVFSMLKSGSHVTGEIATGEGKSRIMAINNACQLAMGKTVDCLTSDMELATRDYLSFKSFYEALGAQTSLIYSGTEAEQYQLEGINFSDDSNLSLFRNKARSNGKANLVIAEKPEKRALSLDEGDKAIYDMAEIRFNYSQETDASIKGMETWVYDLLINFFSQEDLKEQDIARKFMRFASSELNLYPKRLAKLKGLSSDQLTIWQQAAVTALSLQVGEHFVIEGNASVMTPSGAETVSQARVLAGFRVSKESKFSLGVHQCLHARLNRLLEHPQLAKPEEKHLVEQLSQLKHPFQKDSEKQIVYSSTSKTLLDDYNEGTLVAITGTAGSSLEREEVSQLYDKMTFVFVPRHHGLKRIDRPAWLTANKKHQVKVLVEEIKKARDQNQPILIVCENERKSLALYNALTKEGLTENIQHVHSQSQDEAKAIENAGQAGFVTVTTPILGRGVHIPLDDLAKKKGLKVFATFLPSPRDWEQIAGRSGRFGEPGEAQLILNKRLLKKRLNKNTLTDGFYTAPETYLKRQQTVMDRRKQCIRLIKNKVSLFDKAYQDRFYHNSEQPRDEQQKLFWSRFTADKDRAWNEQFWPSILDELFKNPPDLDIIQTHLNDFKDATENRWNQFCVAAQLPMQDNAPPIELILDEKTKNLLSKFDLNQSVQHQVKTFDNYEPAHDGRAVIYSKPFRKLVATLKGERELFANFKAWRRGNGILFPNLRAWWRGEMSLKQFLIGGKAAPVSIKEQDTLLPEHEENNSLKALGRLGGHGRRSDSDETEEPRYIRGSKRVEENTPLEPTPRTPKNT